MLNLVESLKYVRQGIGKCFSTHQHLGDPEGGVETRARKAEGLTTLEVSSRC